MKTNVVRKTFRNDEIAKDWMDEMSGDLVTVGEQVCVCERDGKGRGRRTFQTQDGGLFSHRSDRPPCCPTAFRVAAGVSAER